MAFISIFIAFLIAYGLIGFYLGLRLYQGLELIGAYRWIGVGLLIALILVIFLYILRIEKLSGLSAFGYYWGTWVMPIILYGFLSILSIDIIRLILHLCHYYPIPPTSYIHFKFYLTCSVIGLIVILLFVGHMMVLHPKVIHQNIAINKSLKDHQNLRIALISDIHLNPYKNQSYLQRIVDSINAEQVDLVLIAGDIYDGDKASVINNNIGQELKLLQSQYGTYACTGNHDIMGGMFEKGWEYLNSLNINLLIDSTANITDGITIIGRRDLAGQKLPIPLKDILASTDTSQVTILLDHQPSRLTEASQNNIDLQLSGHTHHGQMWPLNYITQSIFECDWGYFRKGNTQFYISCGAGIWGPQIRIGSRSEIVILNIQFN